MQSRFSLVGIGATLLITAIMVVGLFQVEIDASIGTMLVSHDEAQKSHDQYKTWFGSDEVLSIAVPFSDSLSPSSLILQRELVAGLESIDGVVQVTALVSQDEVVGETGSLDVRQLIPDDIDRDLSDQEEVGRIRARVLGHPIWNGWLVSASLNAVAFHVRLDDTPDGEQRRAHTLRDIDVLLEASLGKDAYYLAGHPFMKSEIARSIAVDLARLLPIALIAMTLLLLIATRSLYVGGITALAVLLTVVWMVGAMGWCGLGMTALTNTAPTIMVALATACFLHYTAAYQAVPPAVDADPVLSALRQVRRPTWIAATTTALGYASLGMSSVPIVREFGYALAIGVVGMGIVATVSLPAVFAVFPKRGSQARIAEGFGLGRLLLAVAQSTTRFARSIVACSLFIGLFMIIAALDIDVDSSGPGRFATDSRFRVSSQFYRSQLSGDVLESAYFEGEPGDFLEPARLRSLQRFAAAALQLPEVDKVVSIADYVARTYWVFRGEVGDPLLLPDSPDAVAQLMLLYESAGDYGGVSDYVSGDYSRVRVVLTADVQSSSVSRQLKSDLNDLAERFLPHNTSEHSVVSTEMLLSRAADVIAVEQIRSASLALVLVLLVISISFRSVRVGLLVVLPNTLPIAMNLGMMALLGISLSDATSIISATAIGIAVDSTVHILSSVRKAEFHSCSRRAAVLHALVNTGRPVIISSTIVVLGFSFLLLSDFGSVAELGALTALTMIYCLFADLFVLPAQLLFASRVRSEADPAILLKGEVCVVSSGVVSESGDWTANSMCEPEGSPNSEIGWRRYRFELNGRVAGA